MSKRNISLDVIRVIAIFSVVFIHFLLNSDFYTVPINSNRLVVINSLRVILCCCVPLFLLLTGYLMSNKALNQKYYKGIIKTISLYVIISLLCALFKKYYIGLDISFGSILLGMFDFSNDSYSWYVKMYIGIYLLIPFLNIIVNNIDRKSFNVLLITLITLTILPTLINVFDFTSLSNFVNSNVNSSFRSVANDYWLVLWPFTYYLSGAYIKKYDIKLEVRKLIIPFLFCFLAFSIFNNIRNYNYVYLDTLYNQYFSFETYILSILLFIGIYSIDFSKVNKCFKSIIIFISNYSFGVYLSSWIFDYIFYNILKTKIFDINDRMIYIFVIPIIVFVCSLIVSYIATMIYKACYKMIIMLIEKIKKVIKKCNFSFIIKNKNIILIFSIIFFIICYFILMFNKIKYGVGSADESFYLTIPLRMCKGDILIINEWHLSQLSSFIIYPIMKIYLSFFNTTGIIYNFRILFIFFKIICGLIFYQSIKKYNKYLSLLSLAMFLLYTPYNIAQFSYNSMGNIFVALFSVVFFNKTHNKINKFFAGVFLALAVLCSPYFAIVLMPILLCYIIDLFRKKYSLKKQNYVYFIIGGSLIALLILLYFLMNSSINKICEVLPYLFKDPEHSTGGKLATILLLIKTIVSYYKYSVPVFIISLLCIILEKLVNKKIIFKNFYLIINFIAYIFQIILLNGIITINYNFIMVPLFFIGILASIMLLLDNYNNQNNKIYIKICAISLIYSLCLVTSSNQLLYAFSTGVSLGSFITPLILFEYKKEYFEKAWFEMAVYAICILQIVVQVNSVNNHVFPMFEKNSLHYEIKDGPLMGILTSKEEVDAFKALNNDLNYIKKLPSKGFLCYNCLPYVYLYVDFPISAHSGWGGDIEYQIQAERDYQILNENKVPAYVYINAGDINYFDENYKKLYNIKELSQGYLLERKDYEKVIK